MDTKLLFPDAAGFATPMLAVFAVDIATAVDADPLPALLSTSDAVTNAAAKVIASGEFKATLGETLLLHSPSGLKAERLLIIGLGKAKSLTPHEVRKGAGVAVRFAGPRNLRDLALVFPEHEALPAELTARAVAEGAIVADFDIDFYRSDRKDQSIHSATVLAPGTTAEIQRSFDEGIIVAEAQNFARTLVNEPGNVLTPTELGKRTKAMCDEFGLQCEVHSIDKILELKMGAFAAVTQGSSEPPALIVMRYE